MRVRAVLLAAALVLAPPGARAADLVVWWDEGFAPAEDDAVREMMAAFEHKTGKTVELSFFPPEVLRKKLPAAVVAGQPPDFAFTSDDGVWPPMAREGQLTELSAALGPLADLIDPDALAWSTLPNRRTGHDGLYSLPMARTTTHVHVWKSLLEQAGLSLADIPKEWGRFWSFWCDKVQPAVRKATGRNDIFGVGAAMSSGAQETGTGLRQFADALTQDWPVPWGMSLSDDPLGRATLVRALTDYTAIYQKGCTPPEAIDWDDHGNNDAFIAQNVVMTTNQTLSIPNAIRRERPADYAVNVATIEWPSDAYGRPLHIEAVLSAGAVFAGPHDRTTLDFVRFFVRDGWIAYWPTFAGDRYLPVLAKLQEQPFWLDPSDPHRMRSVIEITTKPQLYGWWGLPDAQRRHGEALGQAEDTAVHRVVADGLTPEQAADEMIVTLRKLLLSE